MDRRFMFKYRAQNMSITYHFAHPELPFVDGDSKIEGSLTGKSLSNGYSECDAIQSVNEPLGHSLKLPMWHFGSFYSDEGFLQVA